jgi:lipoprotein-releasing system permease protein
MEVFGMLQYRFPDGQEITRPVKVLGVDPESRSGIGGFKEYLVDQTNHPAAASFEVPERIRLIHEEREKTARMILEMDERGRQPLDPDTPPPPALPPFIAKEPRGAVVGNLIAKFRTKHPVEKEKTVDNVTIFEGDSITLIVPGGNKKNPIVHDSFVTVAYFKSDMSEYDGHYVFVPLDYLQQIRGMEGRATSIQIKLKDYEADSKAVVARLRDLFPHEPLRIDTWEEKQGPLLRAIQIEKNILNVLLFLIVGVAGFGILAIFSMFVAEKTKDIGVLKALGASNGGVMRIFLGYGLLLGVVGSVLGSGLGLLLTNYINEIEHGLAWVSGQHIFNPEIYYFNEIPTEIQPWAVVMVNVGALVIAVVFSILPALRAARLHPVQALRYE